MTPTDQLQALAARFERDLGDPHDPASVLSFAQALDLDEREQYPYVPIGQLRRLGLFEYIIPGEFGGKAVNVEDGFTLLRLVGRRDPTTATAVCLSFLNYVTLWMSATGQQRAHYAEALRNGATFAFALSERDHGSDLVNNEVVAERIDGGYLLSGEKWPIGNATVSDMVIVFARTGRPGRPDAASAFLVDKRRVPAGTLCPLPMQPRFGLRGSDLSGIRLDRCPVPDSALLGREGEGLEIALRSTLLPRVAVNSFVLGGADTCLRIATDFARPRRLYGGPVSDIPYTRRQLVECLADLLIGDAVAGVAAIRGLQAVPEQASLWSSTAKYFVPTLLFERTLPQISNIIGARYYLRADPLFGPFQKMFRDITVALFADGNTVVNLRTIGLALDGLLANATEAPARLRDQATERAATLFDLDASLPEFRPAALELYCRGMDDGVLAMPAAIAGLRRLATGAKGQEADRLTAAAGLAERMLAELAELRADQQRLKDEFGTQYSQCAELLELAKQYCVVHAAAAVVSLNVHSAGALPDPFPSGAVLLACLDRLWRQLHPRDRIADHTVIDEAVRVLFQLHDENRLFSFRRVDLAGAVNREPTL